jgi:CRP-like cAMP-binding protein
MSDNVVFSGSLLFLSLADVFQLLGGNSCTGKLTLHSKYTPDPGIVYFAGGNPVKAYWGTLKGINAIYGMFGWTDGKYYFSDEDIGTIEPDIGKPMMEIVLEASRGLDDGRIARLGPEHLYHYDRLETGEGSELMPHLLPLKGPPVDYLYVTGDYVYPDGAIIVREGEYGKWLWVISEGTVKIVRESHRGIVTLARLGEGCFIGTIRSLIYGGDHGRSATAIAEGNVHLSILDTEVLHREFISLSDDFRNLLLSLDNRLRPVNDNAVDAYMDQFSRGLPTDANIEERFQSTTDLFIIREGRADIIGKGPRDGVHLFSLGPGDVFGKIPFMAFGHEPLAAYVMTSKTFEADVLDSVALQKEYNNLSHTFRNFVFGTATNISMTTKLFYQLLGKT